MASCELCHNETDDVFQVVRAGEAHVFDSFECAIHVMAPQCAHCGCRVMGHPVRRGDRTFCCEHCAGETG